MDTELKERIVYWEEQFDLTHELSFEPHLTVGTRVKLVGCSSIQIQWGSNHDPQEDGILVGAEGIVEQVEVHTWHTKIWVRIDNRVFGPYNSICFEEVK